MKSLRWTMLVGMAIAVITLSIAASNAGAQQSSVVGKYFSESHPQSQYFIELRSDRTFVIAGSGGRAMIGTYEVEGDQITLKAQMQRPARFKLLGKTLIDPEGERWTQKSTGPLVQSPRQEAAPGAGTSKAANAGVASSSKYPQGDTILIGTETNPVRVKNFYRTSKGTDEYGGVILEKTPAYIISYNQNMGCFETSQHQGCFGIDLTERSVKSDQLNAEKLLMTRLTVSQADFCKLPIAVTTLEDKITGSKVSTPPSPCPNGALHYLK